MCVWCQRRRVHHNANYVAYAQMPGCPLWSIGYEETRPRIRRKKESGDGTTWEKKTKKTEAEMDGLCQPGHESHRNDGRWSRWQNWLEQNNYDYCVCRSDPTTKWERLEEEEVIRFGRKCMSARNNLYYKRGDPFLWGIGSQLLARFSKGQGAIWKGHN